MTTGRRPTHLRGENGPEFIAAAVKGWLQQEGVQTAVIEPGAPWRNGQVESDHASLRAELLDRELFYDLEEVQVMADSRRTIPSPRSLGLPAPGAAPAGSCVAGFRSASCGTVPPSSINTQLIAAD